MAKAQRRGTPRGGRARGDEAAPAAPRDRIIDALMALLAEKPIAAIGLAEVAAAADVPLGTLRKSFEGKLGILAAFSRRIDLAVLGAGAADPSAEARDRLFEAEMRRFDALAPYKEALHGLAGSARRDPFLAAALHRIAKRSQMWTLVAAGIHHGGILGRIAVEGAVMVYLEAMRTWFEDDDEDLARTMAALDRALRRGERAMRFLDDVCSLGPRVVERGRRARGRRPAPPGARSRGRSVNSDDHSPARIGYDDFQKVEIRVGTVVEALPFPEARKPAYQLRIDFGPEIGVRKSSAQITRHYRLGDLVGRQVAAVVNFPPRQIGPMMSEVLTLGFPDEAGEVVLVGPERKVPNGGRLF